MSEHAFRPPFSRGANRFSPLGLRGVVPATYCLAPTQVEPARHDSRPPCPRPQRRTASPCRFLRLLLPLWRSSRPGTQAIGPDRADAGTDHRFRGAADRHGHLRGRLPPMRLPHPPPGRRRPPVRRAGGLRIRNHRHRTILGRPDRGGDPRNGGPERGDARRAAGQVPSNGPVCAISSIQFRSPAGCVRVG